MMGTLIPPPIIGTIAKHYFLTLSAECVWNNEPLQIIFQNSPNDAFLNELVRQNGP